MDKIVKQERASSRQVKHSPGVAPVVKVLNLYAGIGGNRKLWTDVEVTAVELDPKVAAVYLKFHPEDTVIVGDAHQYLLEHFKEFDFIWSSPPCPSHSQLGRLRAFNEKSAATGQYSPPKYPDMKLYEEILLLQHYYQGKYVVENVISYYDPLITPKKIDRHYYWANFYIPTITHGADNIEKGLTSDWATKFGYDTADLTGLDKRKALRNCVNPQMGLHIFNAAWSRPGVAVTGENLSLALASSEGLSN